MRSFAAVLGVALAFTGVVAAQQPSTAPRAQAPSQMDQRGPGPMRGMGGMFPFMGETMGMAMYAPDRLVDRRDALKLTPDQVSKLDALAQDTKQARDKARADAKASWDQLSELWQQETPDVSQLRTRAQAAMRAMEVAHLAQLTAMVQAKAVLTPEQRGRVAGWADAMRHRMGPGSRMMNRGMRAGRSMPGYGRMRMDRGMRWGPPNGMRAPRRPLPPDSGR